MDANQISRRSLGDSNDAKYALGLHTTSPELGLGLNNFKGESRYRTWTLGRALSTHLHGYLAEFILPQAWSDLSSIAVAKGPGSFTGSRIGIVTARTLAQQLNIPLFAISSLATLAELVRSRLAESQAAKLGVDRDIIIAAEIPAQRGEVLAAIYQVVQSQSGLAAVLPDTSLSVQGWQQTLETWSSHHQVIRVDEREVSAEDVCKALLALAHQRWHLGDRPHWSEALPFYGQQPQAQSMPVPKP